MKNLNAYLVYAAVISSLLLLISPLQATTCANAIPITTFPVVDQPLFCGVSNDLNATTVPTVCGATPNTYKAGREALYRFTPSSSGAYSISYNGQLSYTSIFVYNGCPTEGGVCVGGFGADFQPETLTVNLTAGVTYYIWFDIASTLGSPACPGAFNLTLQVPNDDCTNAIAFPVLQADGSCAAVIVSTVHATDGNDSYPFCSIASDDNVWYTFTTPPGITYLVYSIQNIEGYSFPEAFQVLQGSCNGGFTSLGCYSDEQGVITGLSGNTTYYLQAYKLGAYNGSIFEVCLRLPAVNDSCAQATPFPLIPLNHDCVSATVNTINATNSNISSPPCDGSAEDDVWFTFTTPPGVSTLFYDHTNISGSTSYRMLLYSNDCAGLTYLSCYSANSGTLNNLIPNTTYYLRVYSYYSDSFTKFDLCLRVPLPNDNCDTATAFPDMPSDGTCASMAASTVNATAAVGSVCTGMPDDDIWFSFSTPAGVTNLQYAITHISGSEDLVINLYRNSCNERVGCFDSESGIFPLLLPGTLYKIQIYTKEANASSVFDICLGIAPPLANDFCGGAIPLPSLPLDGSCIASTISTIGSMGSNDISCFGVEDDDVWYKFTTPSGHNSVYYGMTSISGDTDHSFQVYRGTCANGLISVGCYDNENGIITGLTGNTTYYLRAYTFDPGVVSVFNLCLGVYLQPVNDNCTGATTFPALPIDGSCSSVTVTTAGATGTTDPTCTGEEDDDVWYVFSTPAEATALLYEFTTISGNTSRAFQVFQGTCNGLVSIGCYTPATGGFISGLTGNTTYYLRIYTQLSGVSSTFQLCLRLMPPPPPNDDCVGALAFPSIPADGSEISYTFTTFGATGTPDNTCQGTEDDDVWIAFTVPAGTATLLYNYTNIEGNNELYFQLFSGDCGNLTPVNCYTSASGFITNLSSGSTYYLRAYTRLASVFGSFQLTMKTATVNDECLGALALPDFPLNGDCASVFISTTNATPSATGSGLLCSFPFTLNDLWYTFSVPAGVTYLSYEIEGLISNTYRLQVFSGDCSGLSSLGCYQDPEGVITGLSSGIVYYLRSYSTSSSTPTELSLCLRLPPLNDACSGAVAFPSIPADGSCAIVSASTLGATGNPDPTCSGSEDDDIWYTFTTPPGVTSLVYNINIPNTNTVIYSQLFSGACSGLASIGCYYSHKVALTGLTGNSTYYLRLYSQSTSSKYEFDICLSLPTVNDDCASAIAFPDLLIDGSCSTLTASTKSATGTLSNTCTGSEDDDVWFSFTTPPNVNSVSYEVLPISGDSDLVLQVFSGLCGTQTSKGCYDPGSGTIVNLTGSTTYYIRAYTWASQTSSTFSICLRSSPPQVPPVNDNCTGALPFADIPLDGSCTTVTALILNATSSTNISGCASSSKDVWFIFTTPPGISKLAYKSFNFGNANPTLQIFNSECNNLTSIGCYTPDIGVITGLNGGTTYYLRASNASASPHNFDICLQLLPFNDECPGAIAFPAISSDGSCSTLNISTSIATGTPDPTCTGTENDDMWYTFTTPPDVTTLAYQAIHQETAFERLSFQIFSGDCNNLTSIGCFNREHGTITGLSANTTYYLRAYSFSDLVSDASNVVFCLRRLPPNDDCSGAVPFPDIPLDGSCASVIASTTGATGISPSGSCGTADDDIWYTFTTPPGITALHYSTTIIAFDYDLVFEILGGSCGNMVSLGCYNQESGSFLNLNENTTYYLRIYTRSSGPLVTSSFSLCLRIPPPNDHCSEAIAFPDLPLDGSCAAVNVSMSYASPSGLMTCSALNYSDVWYKFTTPPDVETILYQVSDLSSSTNPNTIFQIFSGTCDNFTDLGCYANSFDGAFTGLLGGTTYYLRVNVHINEDPTFKLCLRPTPVNDVCQHAFAFPDIPADGSFSTVTAHTARATGTPDPTCSGHEDDDVWFSFTTPPNATYLLSECSVLEGSDPSNFQVLSGVCGQLTSIGCYGSLNDGSTRVISGLTGNRTYYIRAYSNAYSLSDSSTFSISLRLPLPNDNCANATLISGCDATINGSFYGATEDEIDNSCLTDLYSGSKGVWYRLIGDGLPVMLHTCLGDDSDSGIRVYSGSCDAFTCITGNKGACSSGSQVSWIPAIGEEYYIFLYSTNDLNYTLSFIGGAQCPNIIGQASLNIEDDEVTISWPTIAGVESSDYTLSTNGICSSGTVQTTTGNSVSFSSLQTNVQYTFCLRSNCSCYETDFASITFAIPLANDYCTTAIPVLCGATIAGSTEGAISDSALGNCGSGTGAMPGRGIWYKLAGDGSLITLDLCASSFDTKVHVYKGTCGSLLCVASNDDACGAQSSLSFHALTDQDYFILVSGTDSNMGDFAMNISCICEEPLGTPWTVTDIGGASGTAINNYCGGTIDISSDGVSASSASDVRLFAFQNFCDSVAITAKVNHTTTGDFAGIILRESTAAGARMISLKSKGTKYVYLEIRSIANGTKNTQQFLTLNHKWLRMVRNGNQIIGYSSGNGVHWQQHFSVSLAMPSCIDAGLFAESTELGAPAMGAFSNVSIVPSTLTIVLPNGEFPTEENPTEGGGDYFVYPNPTESAINVKMGEAFIDKELTITIINQLGQMVAIRKIREVQDPIETFDVRHLPPGVYIITLRTEGGGTLAKKFVVGASAGAIKY